MSSRLETLIQDSDRDELNVLCELQLAFVCFLIGQVYDAFEQWKSLVSLLCNCDRAIVRRASFFYEFLSVFYFQLKEMPEDFFIDIISKDNFLTVNLHNLFDNINDATQASDSELNKLKEKSEKFKNYLSQRFAIDFEQEPDEYAPVVCGEV
jgi:A1 cistron-splicing factor AAR2